MPFSWNEQHLNKITKQLSQNMTWHALNILVGIKPLEQEECVKIGNM